MTYKILRGHCIDVLRTLEDESVQLVCTSPPYWGLRSYLRDGDPLKSSEIGLEKDLAAHLETLVSVFREVHRVLRKDGVCYVNYGDAYATGTAGARKPTQTGKHGYWENPAITHRINGKSEGLKPKDRMMLPARLAIAMQEDDGSDIYELRHDLTDGELAECLTRIQSARKSILGNTCANGGQKIQRPTESERGKNEPRTQRNTANIHDGSTEKTKRRKTAAPSPDTEPVMRDCESPLSKHTEGQSLPVPAAESANSHSLLLITPMAAVANIDENCKNSTSLSGNISDEKDTLRTDDTGSYVTTVTAPLRSTASVRMRKCEIPNDLIKLFRLVRKERWYVRDEIIYHKLNPMPTSVHDRTTPAHEMVYMFSKSARYFYDAFAIREPASSNTHARAAKIKAPDGWDTGAGAHGTIHRNGREKGKTVSLPGVTPKSAPEDSMIRAKESWHASTTGVLATRNKRSVWSIATEPSTDDSKHYAAYPTALVLPMIRAGTSEKGCCAKCGAPWTRNVEQGEVQRPRRSGTNKASHVPKGQPHTAMREAGYPRNGHVLSSAGWSPGCACDAPIVPCTVLDPFLGSGTTALVADRLGRHCIGIELSDEYADYAERRVREDSGELFSTAINAITPDEQLGLFGAAE